MPVELINQHPNIPSPIISDCRKASERVIEMCDVDDHQVNIVLMSDAAITELNSRYRNLDKATNVLSFAFDENNEVPEQIRDLKELGDVVISFDRAVDEAKTYECTVQHRLNWLIIHGVLHLLGYDHERSQRDAEIMFGKEQSLLTQINDF